MNLEENMNHWGKNGRNHDYQDSNDSASTPEPLASGFLWKTTNRKMSRDHGLVVAFAVCSSRLNGRKGFQGERDLRQGFLPLKIVQPRVERYEIAFYIRLRCVCLIFDLESMNYYCFLGDKSDALRLDEKQHGGTK